MSRDRGASDGRDAVDEIEIASPCSVPWDGMRGDDRVRFCDRCHQNVYNIEALARHEARALMTGREGRVCLRILRRSDGTVVTADCWSRLRAARRRGVAAFVATFLVILWVEWIAGLGLQTLRRFTRPRSVAPTVAQSNVPRLVPKAGRVAPPPTPEEPAPPPEQPSPRKTTRRRAKLRAPRPDAGRYTAGAPALDMGLPGR